jgi:hypothetical protein
MEGELEPALPPAALLVIHGEVCDLRSAAASIAAQRARAKARLPVPRPAPPTAPPARPKRKFTFGPIPILR